MNCPEMGDCVDNDKHCLQVDAKILSFKRASWLTIVLHIVISTDRRERGNLWMGPVNADCTEKTCLTFGKAASHFDRAPRAEKSVDGPGKRRLPS